ncbi:hypothetical protein [Aeromonas dhakensis]|uniref:hypothetical protein n=1 Tax=Aeromonas dhakensis TaxID=196024 RepID=UPI0005A7FF1E|nr:hypothetical protein [Aeromonas dhakensis]
MSLDWLPKRARRPRTPHHQEAPAPPAPQAPSVPLFDRLRADAQTMTQTELMARHGITALAAETFYQTQELWK